jgi:hypothetical protein
MNTNNLVQTNKNSNTNNITNSEMKKEICEELYVDIPENKIEENKYNLETDKLTSRSIAVNIFKKATEWFHSFFLANRPIPSENKSIIIVATCHGLIPCSPISLPYTYTGPHLYTPQVIDIPENIEIHKFTISSPGVIAIGSEPIVNFYLEKIYSFSEKLLNSTIDENLVTDIFTSLKEIYSNLYKYNNNPEYKYYSEKGYKYFLLRNGDKIINKYFLRDLSEKNPDNTTNDFSILEISDTIIPLPTIDTIPLLPDLLTSLFGDSGLIDRTSPTDPHQSISLEDMITYYRNKGVQRIIIFDFTCSVFAKYEITEHEVLGLEYLTINEARNIRRNLCKENAPYGGKKNKYNKYSKKSKRKPIKRKKKKTKTKKVRK